jgi:hypothetical protein
MERNDPPSGRRVSSFDQLFRTALVGTVEAVLAASGRERNSASPARTEDGDPIAAPLRTIAEAYHGLWLQHSQSIRLSVLEAVLDADEWERLKTFIRTYGGDLFTGRFLTLSNVRGILREGVVEWMNRLTDPDTEPGANVFGSAEHPTDRPKLADHWETEEVNRTDATRHLELVLQAIVEHYDEYRDYNTTTTQSDYGENLYILLDYLRLKVAYNRYAWRLTPWTLAHDVLCRRGFDDLAEQWRDFIASRTKRLSADLLKELNAREAEHAIRLRTIRDRLEEQFLQPLQIDRAAARVVHAAAAIRDGQPEMNPDFAALQAAVAPLAASPSGVGLDVPLWLRRLEEELRRVQGHLIEHEDDETEPDAAEPPDLDPMPQVPPLTLEELKRQLSDWEEPIGEG